MTPYRLSPTVPGFLLLIWAQAVQAAGALLVLAATAAGPGAAISASAGKASNARNFPAIWPPSVQTAPALATARHLKLARGAYAIKV